MMLVSFTIQTMGTTTIPHPIPYQGSKRKLCAPIASHIPSRVHTLYEPFAGSAAFSLYAAKHHIAERFVLGDVLEPLIALWKLIVSKPEYVVDRYTAIWAGQTPNDFAYYNRVREEYNQTKEPSLLLYLIVRCVKNAVRFSQTGNFTQSQDKRRTGMRPSKMREAIYGASALLKGRVEFFAGDFEQCIATATENDLIYLDPPYQGTSYGRDKRYYRQLEMPRLVKALRALNERHVPFLLSYDGLHGEKEYGLALPDDLKVQRVLLNAGRSSQATLNGKNIVTYESLYVSTNLIMEDYGVADERTPQQLPLGF